MTSANLPINETDNYLDTNNPRIKDAIVIVSWLIENEDLRGEYTYSKISEDVDIPQPTVREFLVEDVWAFRKYSYLLNLRKRNRNAYLYYLSNSKDHNYIRERDGAVGCWINLSKFSYLRFVAHTMGYYIRKNQDTRKMEVYPLGDSGIKAVLPGLLDTGDYDDEKISEKFW